MVGTEKTFTTFAKVNDRHFKVVRQRARIAPELEEQPEYDADTQSKDDIYSERTVDILEENDEIAANEAAFMRGYMSA